MTGHLILKDGTIIEGESFGSETSRAGEVVFSTGMVGYPEGITDPSYQGQILTLTYPIIGNYGVPEKSRWESSSIKISGLIVSNYNNTPSHFQSERTLSEWLIEEGIPALVIKDTRYLAQKLRDEGSTLGKIVIKKDVDFYDPNTDNLIEKISTEKPSLIKTNKKLYKNILYIDCGGKNNMIKCLIDRGANVLIVPWNFDPFNAENIESIQKIFSENNLKKNYDGVVVSNGPGDPKMAVPAINTAKKIMERKIPLLGICLGHQIICLAADGNTSKLKFGHRSQNQPCILQGTNKCYITTQNHGFAVSKLPVGFKTWFYNANDNSNEGIIHEKYPFMSVQFHPEASPGPEDTEWIFDFFLEKIN